jgi:hypothetical protein
VRPQIRVDRGDVRVVQRRVVDDDLRDVSAVARVAEELELAEAERARLRACESGYSSLQGATDDAGATEAPLVTER